MIRCRTCLYPKTKPDLHFEDGECSACAAARKKPEIDWEARHEELLQLLDKHHGECVVPSSGGKDSTWQVLKLQEIGAHVTVVTARTCHLTEIGRKNIDNLARFAKTIEVVPNQTVRAKLNKIGLEQVGDISWPEHVSIFTAPFNVAAQIGIPLVFYGENPQNAYGGPPGSQEQKAMSKRWVMEFGGFLGLRPQDLVGVEGLTHRDMSEYTMNTGAAELVNAYFLGQFIEWDSRRNAAVAMENGMQIMLPTEANWWDYENLDNAQTGVHDWFGWLKYGYGRGCAQISVDIRAGRVAREDAAQWVHAQDGLFPHEYCGVPLEEVLDRIGMGPIDFLQCANDYMNTAIFNEDQVRWGQQLTLKA